MSDEETPASEQGGGATPAPGLGVPGLGVPAPISEAQGSTPGQPEIVEDYYPYVGPQTPQQPAPKKRVFRLTAGRMILLVFIVLGVSGAIVTQVRHASATPADKTACASTLNMIQSPNTGGPAMLHDLEFANDKTLLGARGDMTTHIEQQNAPGLGDDINRVIHRCNQISSEFKSGFQSFCDSHPGECKESFHIGPF